MSTEERIIRHLALHSRVLLIYTGKQGLDWACYCAPIPGILSHESEALQAVEEGQMSKVPESLAKAAYPALYDMMDKLCPLGWRR